MKFDNYDVVLLGYKPTLAGGVANVTEVLLANQENVRLHPILHCYKPVSVAFRLYLVSILKFIGIVGRRKKPMIAHLIVGSKGDRTRAVPYLLLCRALGIPVCIQYHTNAGALFCDSRSIPSRLTDRLFARCDLHVLLSKRLEKEFRHRFPSARQTRIIGNALSDNWMGLPKPPLEERGIDVIFFGRWSAEKGINDLVRYLESTERPIKCEIYTNHIPEFKIRHATVKPWASEKEVIGALHRSKLLVLPSYFEAYPTVLLEALACGTPFVASNVGGIADIAEQSNGGIVVEAGDPAQFKAAIDSLLQDKLAWSRKSQLGRTWVNRTCNKDQILPLWKEAYDFLASC